MRLKSLSWNRYRNFKGAEQPEIAPITVLIGKNGSGKSVISRLPLMLSAALSENSQGPLSLDAGGIDHAESYQDLVYQRGSLPFTIGAQIEVSKTSFSFSTILRYIRETRSLAVEGFQLKINDERVVALDIDDVDQLGREIPLFKIDRPKQKSSKIPVFFEGLFPVSSPGLAKSAPEIFEAQRYFQEVFANPSYLGPFREEPVRTGRMPSQSIKSLGPRGERALDLLADDKLRRGGKLSEAVSKWFQKSMHQAIDIDLTNDTPRVVVANRRNDVSVSLADTGAGFAQVLPIVVQHFAHRLGRLHSRILIVEQPELHLHPGAHGALADLIIETSMPGQSWGAVTSIVETHSEQFITRLRRRAAEGKSHKSFAILSLEHIDASSDDRSSEPLRQIGIDRQGDPSSWPSGVFEESLDDLTAMRQASRS